MRAPKPPADVPRSMTYDKPALEMAPVSTGYLKYCKINRAATKLKAAATVYLGPIMIDELRGARGLPPLPRYPLSLPCLAHVKGKEQDLRTIYYFYTDGTRKAVRAQQPCRCSFYRV